MSSFKRKGTSKPAIPTYAGTRICPGSVQTLLTSTGISSLDDILGGGLALSCSLVMAAPDLHSSYGELVLKYFVAQGLISGHRVCVVGGAQEELMRFVKECMWVANSNPEDDEDEGDDQAQKIKIAWRYEKMKQFKTTVGSSFNSDGESYCQAFDLSSMIPEEAIDDGLKTDRLHLIDVFQNPSISGVLEEVTRYLSSDTSAPVRICIPNLGSPVWGDLTAQSILYFLHSLRARLREDGHGCAAISLPPHLSVRNWGGEGWLEKVGWMSSGLLSLAAFSANPGLSTLFPAHHGLVQIYSLPSPHTYGAPSDRFSILRGLGSSGENNLAFKCTRRRFLIETLHLDVEGGTGERRTTASKTAVPASTIQSKPASVEGKKKKKVVGFQSDRPELCQGYDSNDELLSMPLLSDGAISSHTRSYSKALVNQDFVIQDEAFHHPRAMDSNHYPDHHSHAFKHHLYNNSQPQAYTPPTAAVYPNYPGDEDSIATAITTDSQMHPQADPVPLTSPRSQPPPHRTQDPSRWSSSYSAGARSRSSSIVNGYHDVSSPPLSTKPSYDISWRTVDEKDEVAISEEETDDEQGLDNLDDEPDKDDGEPTSAALVAEQGRGLIVHADTVPILQLQIQPDTTHLLLGSSTTPNAVPAFLTSSLPQIAHSLLALDISANFLGALPPVLAVCENLEELNVASNPLRVLPVFLADLINLRVLIADSTGITTLPDTLVDLDKIHTISIRRNKLYALPSWLCLLPALQTLCVDGNPFQGPWKALVDPLLAKVATTPVYPPSTPMMPLSASVQSPQSTTNPEMENDGTDIDELSDQDVSSPNGVAAPVQSLEEEDQTVTFERTMLGRAKTAPYPLDQQVLQQSPPRPLVRTRTTPNRAYHDQARAKSSAGLPSDPRVAHQGSMGRSDDVPGVNNEIRKMKSAGDLRRSRPVTAHGGPDDMPHPPPIANFPTSLSSSNLLSMGGAASAIQNANSPTVVAGGPEIPYPKRFASLGPNSQAPTSLPSGRRPTTAGGRPQLSQSLWEPNGVNENGQLARSSSYNPSAGVRPPKMDPKLEPILDNETKPQKTRANQNQKNSRWGFLKKMSMGKMKSDFASSNSPASPNSPRVSRPSTSTGNSPPRQFGSISRMSKTPQIDVRFSTTGALDAFPALTGQQSNPPSPPIPERPSLPPPSAAATNGLLAAPTVPRAVKRRSFLPIDAPGQMSLSIPENSKFVSGVVVSHDAEEQQVNGSPDSNRGTHTPVVDNDQLRRKEEERARDAYMRALRSVMAYLKDMNDLSQAQQSNPLSMYGSSSDEQPQYPRSRRPTVVEREGSSGGSTADSSTHLRSPESIAGMRSGSSSLTLSVATTDSSGSQEERKCKDDKGKRVMVIREIVATERTYVKGLRELVDIYIQPACAPVNLLSGSKDSVVPPSERKVVFGGIESLFSFHKDSFLPALEGATAPLMKPSAELQELDADGQLSLNVAKAVGHIFVKHAAFMRMYSSYINNFESSVQRVKYWTSDKYASGSSSPGNALTPSSSSAHLVGLGISMAMSGGAGILAESLPTVTGIPNLSTSQRKRIKAYLKRCRLNPRHTQLNLEGYLLLPVQRIPRYKLLLEELVRSTPPPLYEYLDDPLDRALSEITALASNMNEGKREAESRRKLVRWQTRIRGKFPSPLVQPHRKLIMDGPLLLTRVVRKAVVSFEAINAQGDSSTVQVDCLAPELTPRPLVGILCNDLLVLCRDPSEGQDPSSPVDLWAVLRMQTLPQPASIVHGNALRLVDNKAILYFDAPSPSDALNWYRAINLHIPASKA